MDTTFISIHDLSDRATTLYTSESVVDVLGYTPDELANRSIWELFHPDELPVARFIHSKNVSTDKAAVLAYFRLKDNNDQWIGCECCFSIVWDVMVACTSIYQRGSGSEQRAIEAPVIRRCFSNSPEDPRYHMLTHLSTKFTQPVNAQTHEPRAALFLNRFTRTLTIMYATNGLKDVVGIPAEEMRGRSFYYCIAENCLQDSVQCLENAKGNNSIAYLRFWFRDPRIDDEPAPYEDSDEEMLSDTSEEGDSVMVDTEASSAWQSELSDSARGAGRQEADANDTLRSRNSSGESTRAADTHEAIFGSARLEESSVSSVAHSPEDDRRSPVRRDPIELEAVISCASDGLVVCLRRARPTIPIPTSRQSRPGHSKGLFAAPWAAEPILPPLDTRTSAGYGPQRSHSMSSRAMATAGDGSLSYSSGPSQQAFMNAIREQAVFAWALTGINGSLYRHKIGEPSGESLPRDGLPIWTVDTPNEAASDSEASTQHSSQGTQGTARPLNRESFSPRLFGDPGLDKKYKDNKSIHRN